MLMIAGNEPSLLMGFSLWKGQLRSFGIFQFLHHNSHSCDLMELSYGNTPIM
ncbi:hypothetical protein MtrunA17_Chr1g0179831 [Medicago truncatula]|uniref:Uncharacterized protein n=1 Tax=Medicago truncatula TaxID=3880 RepID=A0A396JMZ7_MEDTR|nr:hypothetical protein MtrunA17_Chr1g0179831 [Medicago truncatula]